MNEKFSVFVICIGVIIYLLLCNLQDCTFKRFRKLSNPYLHLLFVLTAISQTEKRNYIAGNKEQAKAVSLSLNKRHKFNVKNWTWLFCVFKKFFFMKTILVFEFSQYDDLKISTEIWNILKKCRCYKKLHQIENLENFSGKVCKMFSFTSYKNS